MSVGARTGRVKVAWPSRRKEILVSEMRMSLIDEARVSTSDMNIAYDSSTGRGMARARRMPMSTERMKMTIKGWSGRSFTRSACHRRTHIGSGREPSPGDAIDRSFLRIFCSNGKRRLLPSLCCCCFCCCCCCCRTRRRRQGGRPRMVPHAAAAHGAAPATGAARGLRRAARARARAVIERACLPVLFPLKRDHRSQERSPRGGRRWSSTTHTGHAEDTARY